MKTTLLTILFLPFLIFSQNKFVGEYIRLNELSDTLESPLPNYMYNHCFTIKSDKTYAYYEEENPEAYDNAQRETISGSWKSNGDTITFYNKNYKLPKGYKYTYYENQPFKGVKLVLKNARREPLDFASCLLDSIGIAINPYRGELNNKGIIVDSSCRAISFCPKGYCKDFRQCRIELDITKIKSGTLIELVVYSTEMEMSFNNRKFILTRNILHEIETYNAHGKKITQYNLDESANNFIRKK